MADPMTRARVVAWSPDRATPSTEGLNLSNPNGVVPQSPGLPIIRSTKCVG